jgi:hypothetical protein
MPRERTEPDEYAESCEQFWLAEATVGGSGSVSSDETEPGAQPRTWPVAALAAPVAQSELGQAL